LAAIEPEIEGHAGNQGDAGCGGVKVGPWLLFWLAETAKPWRRLGRQLALDFAP
jgi:hypothetical protein